MRRVLAWVLVAAAIGWGTAIVAAPLVHSPTGDGGRRFSAPAGAGGGPSFSVAEGADGGPRFSVAKMLPTGLAALTYVAGAFVCHQRPERSFHLAGAQLPVCARCAALYWGGAVGLVAWLAFRRQMRVPVIRTHFARAIFILGLPIAVTLTTSALGIWDPGNTFRAMSSAPFGVALGALLAAVMLGDVAET